MGQTASREPFAGSADKLQDTQATATSSACPADHSKFLSQIQRGDEGREGGGGCPVDHSKLDPTNMMPAANQEVARCIPDQYMNCNVMLLILNVFVINISPHQVKECH